MVAESGHEVKEAAAAKPPEKAALQKIPDDLTAGSQPLSSYSYRDPATGTSYLINPNWKIMPRKSPVLAKTAGTIQTSTDWSGQVETRIYECVSPTVEQHQNSIGCQVENEFILVGGGAYVDYGTGPGALLWETRPLDENLTTWVASSKDHQASNPHTLHTYAIGMRLKDNNGNYIPKSALLGTYITLNSYTSTPAQHAPSKYFAYGRFGNSYLLNTSNLGGGARTNWSCCGSLLTVSSQKIVLPATSLSYYVAAKDHGASELTTISIYGIVMTPQSGSSTRLIPNFGIMEFKYSESQGNPVNTGVATALLDASNEFVMTGMGAESKWTTGPGRLLFGIKPTGVYSGQVTVYSKDHRATSGGYVVANMMQVRKMH